MQYSDADLLVLLGQPESNWLERKQSFTAGNIREKISATVCAFANALADSDRPGVILIGVADNLEKRTSRRIDTGVRLLEPLLLLVMATIVTFVIVALLVPVMTMSSNA